MNIAHFSGRLRRFLALAPMLVLLLAPASAHAGLNSWTGLVGLDAANGGGWVREYATGTPPTTIYAATEGGGVFRSTNNGVSWDSFGGLTGAATNVRAVFTSGSTVYAGTQSGLWSSVGGGAFQPHAQGPEEDPANPKKLNLSVQAVLPVPFGPLLAGTFGGGVYRSSDGGATWSPPAAGNGMPASETVWSLAELVPGVVFAATTSGVYRSLDAGVSWTPSNDGIAGTTLRIFADGTRPTIYYVGTAGNGMFRSINAGLTWSAINGSGSSALGNSTVRGLQQFNGVNETRLYAGTGDGLWAGTTGNGPLPGPVRWRKVTQTGLNGNTIMWGLSNFLTTPGTLLAGTQSNGGYHLTFAPPVNTVLPSMSGTLQVGKTVTVDDGTWTGTQKIEYEYQWQRCTTASAASCSDLAQATGSTYAIATADQGNRLRVVVTASNDFPTFGLVQASTPVSSVVTANPGALPGGTNYSAPSITVLAPGNASLPASGDTLRATGWLFNPAESTRSFVWKRCDENGNACVVVPGATTQDLVVTDDDVDRRFKVAVVGSNAAGSNTTPDSGTTNIIFPQPATNVVAPTIAGTAVVGQTLVGNVGQWKFPGTTYTRQWMRCDAGGGSCQTLVGSTSAAYTVTGDDLGARLKMTIVADSNGPNKVPAPVETSTPLSDVVVLPPAPSGGGGGSTPPPPGGGTPGGGTTPKDTTKPVLAKASFKVGKVKRGGALTLNYAISERARFTVRFARLIPGKRVGAQCRPKSLPRVVPCTIVKVVGTVQIGTRTKLVGSVPLAAKVGRAVLPVGAYRATVTPIDAAGNVGAPRNVAFVVVK